VAEFLDRMDEEKLMRRVREAIVQGSVKRGRLKKT